MNKRPVQSKEKDERRTLLVVATTNRHKTEEIAKLLGRRWRVRAAGELGRFAAPRESGKTFEANALIKAHGLRDSLLRAKRVSKVIAVLADDSGLEVRALGGAPGIRSARYAGPRADDARNRARLLRAMREKSDRRAAFRCAIALVPAVRGGRARVFHGSVQGRIARAERGSRGFGYDPLFVPAGFKSTFAEMSPAAKNRLSHRGRALAKLKRWLAGWIEC